MESDVTCGFVTSGLYYVEVCSLYTNFQESFFLIEIYLIHNVVLLSAVQYSESVILITISTLF